MSTINKNLFMVLALCLAFTLGVLSQRPDDADQQEYAAYEDCLHHASSLRCHMTPQDFVRYYELKWKLEEEE